MIFVALAASLVVLTIAGTPYWMIILIWAGAYFLFKRD